MSWFLQLESPRFDALRCGAMRSELREANAQLQKMQSTASQFSSLERELKCKEHEPPGHERRTKWSTWQRLDVMSVQRLAPRK